MIGFMRSPNDTLDHITHDLGVESPISRIMEDKDCAKLDLREVGRL